MEHMELIIYFATMILTWLLGQLAKKFEFIGNHLIPIQNLCVGLIVAIVNFIFTKDFSIAIATSGLMAGGTYDIIHNLKKITNVPDEKEGQM